MQDPNLDTIMNYHMKEIVSGNVKPCLQEAHDYLINLFRGQKLLDENRKIMISKEMDIFADQVRSIARQSA